MSDTGNFTATIEGDKLYQQRAREALPLLVRQAEARSKITYEDLATELGMPNPRNLNFPLGAIVNSLKELEQAGGTRIPPITCVVVNKSTRLPGPGISGFFGIPVNFAALSRARREEIVDAKLQDIYTYTRWPDVLKALGLPYIQPDFTELNRSAAGFRGGETDAHKRLKEYVARTPSLLELPGSAPHGSIERPLPSGDCLDVSFEDRDLWVAAEVKAEHSPKADVIRGLYQCVKYLAVMRAVQTSEGRDRSARAVLVLGAQLPADLIALRNLLGVEVIEGVVPA